MGLKFLGDEYTGSDEVNIYKSMKDGYVRGWDDTHPNDPDPKVFKVEEVYEYDHCKLLVVNYKNCTNFEGRKIIICGKNTDIENELDPHFLRDNQILARFRPTSNGLKLAKKFAETVELEDFDELFIDKLRFDVKIFSL